nr:reverse transcriptase domain-containing protein [Tanacetum cinerariifolium]
VMSTSTHPITIISDFDIEDAFSSTNTPDYIPASLDYFPALPRNTSPDPSKDLSKMDPKRTLTSAAPAITQAAIRKLVTDSVAVALEAQDATIDALSWWNLFAQPIGIEEAYKTTWYDLKKLLTKKYCPRTEVKKMEDEFYNLTVKGNDLKTYVKRFQELAVYAQLWCQILRNS